jgi:integrase
MLEELQGRNYAHRTATAYIRVVRDFAEHFHQSPDKLGPEHIRQFQAHLFQTKKLSLLTVSQYVSALRFLFVKTLRRHFLTEYIPFPKCPKRLPTVLSPEEVTRLIHGSPNLYHPTLVTTLYSTALRRSELCRLKVSDVDRQRMMIRVEQGKGRRDRDVPLSPKLLETLRVYWRWVQPTTFLFPGTVKGVRADVARLAMKWMNWTTRSRITESEQDGEFLRIMGEITIRQPQDEVKKQNLHNTTTYL